MFAGGLAQKTEEAAGDFDAVGDLMGEAFHPLLDLLEILAFDAGLLADALVDQLNEVGDDGERAVEVMDDAGVNLAPVLGHFFLKFLPLQLGVQFVQFFGVETDFVGERAALHGVGHGARMVTMSKGLLR